jgi:hypothetical protein
MLPYTIRIYHTIVRTSTRATPYSLIYGMKAVMPLEREIQSFKVL